MKNKVYKIMKFKNNGSPKLIHMSKNGISKAFHSVSLQNKKLD